LGVYRDFVQEELAIPVIAGRKSEAEKFAGALRTYAIEALMTDGQALQAGTSHHLGQHFARVFDIKYLDSDGQLKYVWQTSWGVSTRLLGAIVMVHGDERGLVLPPRVASIQVVIVPIAPQDTRPGVLAEARAVKAEIEKVARVHLDDREEQSPGWKFNAWELRGVPLRLEIGPQDISKGQVMLVRRDNGEKLAVPRQGLAAAVAGLLESIQAAMFGKAKRHLEQRTREVSSLAELEAMLAEGGGFAVAGWCGEGACEAQIKQRSGATVRVLTEDDPAGRVCLCCGRPAKLVAYLARAY
jgi:prolyl-tRNA synthetase